MTNDELKEKIVDILVNCKCQECAVEYCAICEGNPCIEHCREKEQTDALIAAGIRFGENLTATFDHMALVREHELERRLGEAERRAELAERALNKFAENVTCEDCPFFSDCSSLEKMKDSVHSNYCFAEYLRQAEKELAEERKDD